MARYKVEIANVNTANIKVLTNEEMMELFKKYQNGEKEAKEKLINGNLKLVLSILKKYNNRTENMDDLFQVGCIGLIKSIDNFDLSHGVRFSTYAVPMILGEVKRYLRDNNSVRISRSIKDLAYKILKFKEDYINKYGKEPSLEDIKNNFKITEYEVANAINSLKEAVSMFEPIYNDGGDVIYLEDQIESDDGSIYDSETKIALKEALKKLKEKEQYILTQRYMVGKTQMELAEEIGISQAQISRLEKSGIDSLMKMIS
jgi:RNA polymerase sporulation-specific sigma factor